MVDVLPLAVVFPAMAAMTATTLLGIVLVVVGRRDSLRACRSLGFATLAAAVVVLASFNMVLSVAERLPSVAGLAGDHALIGAEIRLAGIQMPERMVSFVRMQHLKFLALFWSFIAAALIGWGGWTLRQLRVPIPDQPR